MSHRKKILGTAYLFRLPVMTSDKNNCVTKVNLGNIKSESVVERGSHDISLFPHNFRQIVGTEFLRSILYLFYPPLIILNSGN